MAFDVLATHKEINLVRNNLLENLATIEPTTTASTDYDEDAYLVFNGYLYRTMEAITAGDTLDPGEGGNIARVDVASQFGSGSVELTQAEYDALSEDEKMDDVLYLITDSPDNYLDEVFGDFATVEYTDTASKAYAVGDYLVYDNKFYEVTSVIAQGGTIVPNTNVVKTTVAEAVRKRDIIDCVNVPISAGTNTTIGTKTDARITGDHKVVGYTIVFADRSKITSGVDVNTSTGQATITGTCTGATTATFQLAIPH